MPAGSVRMVHVHMGWSCDLGGGYSGLKMGGCGRRDTKETKEEM